MRAASPSRPGLKPDEELKLPIRAGDIVADKYVIEGILGTGGVGVVVSARHTKLDERVAIKFLQTSAMKSAENIERFDREARAAARIKSEHVARVMDFGALPNGAPYMVLEHLDGLDLGALLRSQGRVPFEAAVDYVIQACEAVVEAHALGIVHRDLKPANLFLAKRSDGSAIVKVLDFGISKLLAKDGSAIDLAMTQTSSVIGSPLYMSPEQMQSPKDANELSDIWSLGVLLYELMTGSPPFEAATMPLLCAKICVGDPTPMAARFKPGEPPPPVELEAAIMVCLQRDPGQRPGNVAELVRLIAPFGPEGSAAACERITRVAVQAGMTGSVRPMPPTAVGRASLASIDSVDQQATLQEPTPPEGRQWSWTPGRPLGRRVGSRNLALLGLVLASGFGLGAWGMSARVGVEHSRAPAKASSGREIELVARSAIFAFEAAMAQNPTKVLPAESAELPVDRASDLPAATPSADPGPTATPTALPAVSTEEHPPQDSTTRRSEHTDPPAKHHDAPPHKSSRPQQSQKPGAPETTDVLSER